MAVGVYAFMYMYLHIFIAGYISGRYNAHTAILTHT